MLVRNAHPDFTSISNVHEQRLPISRMSLLVLVVAFTMPAGSTAQITTSHTDFSSRLVSFTSTSYSIDLGSNPASQAIVQSIVVNTIGLNQTCDFTGAADVTLVVFDLLGRRVATLVDRAMAAGRHTVTWQAGDVPSGVCLYQIDASDFRETRQMLLLKLQ